MVSESERITRWFYRSVFPSGALRFDDLLLVAARAVLAKSQMQAEAYVQAHASRLWGHLLSRIAIDHDQRRSPLFVVLDEVSRKLAWLPSNPSFADRPKERHKAIRSAARPSVVQAIDLLSDRQYEALGCVACGLIGATRVFLTPPGNEGGIDFFALVDSPARCHLFHGGYRPFRIVGQSKKYGERVSVDRVKELIETIEEVKNLNPRVERLVPTWFRLSQGPVVGWLIAHNGAQTGAWQKARDHGIVICDSIDLAEITVMSRRFYATSSSSEHIAFLQRGVAELLGTKQ